MTIRRVQHLHVINPISSTRSGSRPSTERDVDVWWDSELAMYVIAEAGKAPILVPASNVRQELPHASVVSGILTASLVEENGGWSREAPHVVVQRPATGAVPGGPHSPALPPGPVNRVGGLEVVGDKPEPDLAAEFKPLAHAAPKPRGEAMQREAEIARELRDHAAGVAASNGVGDNGDVNSVAQTVASAVAQRQADQAAARAQAELANLRRQLAEAQAEKVAADAPPHKVRAKALGRGKSFVDPKV